MCLAAIYWSRASRYHFAAAREDAARADFDDAVIYDELNLAPGVRSVPGYCVLNDEGRQPFIEWAKSEGKIDY